MNTTTSTNSAVRFTIDFFKQTITGTKASFAKAGKGFGPEYEELTAKMAAHPTFTLTVKEQNQFKNLTYERMEKFLSALPKKESYLREYSFVKDFASAVQHNGYSLVRKWFTAQFPEFRTNPLFYLSHSPEVVNGMTFLDEETKAEKKAS